MASYSVNPAGITKARELIEARQYVLDSDWGDSQPSADEENAYLENHDWGEYGEWHLRLTDGAAMRLRLDVHLSSATSGVSTGWA